MSQKYCLDTSVFINAWTKHYRPKVFPKFWTELGTLIGIGTVFSCKAVYDEIMFQDDELSEWAKQFKSMFQEPTEDITHEMSHVMHAFPNFSAHGGAGNAADPWVIAHARLSHATVVTDEQFSTNQRDTKPPKIPNVCLDLDMNCISPVDFLEENGITF